MESRINSAPRVTTNAPANVAAPKIAAAPANTAVNTVDAFSSSRPADNTAAELAELQAVLTELADRITALEAQVAELEGKAPAAAANAPAANGVQLPNGVNLPPLPIPGTSSAAVMPADYAGDDDVVADDEPALNAVANDAAQIKEQVSALQDQVAARFNAANNSSDGANAYAAQQGLESVAHVLKAAKLSGLNAQEEQTVGAGLRRVHEIGRAIAKGDDPAQYAAELFALKHTLAEPGGAGRHPVVTTGAQTIQAIEEHKEALAKQILANQAQLARQVDPDPAMARETAALNARYKGLVNIEKALGGAVLTGLTPTAEQAAAKSVDRLSALADAIASGAADPVKAEAEIYRLGQGLTRPEATAQPAVVDAGADVVARIAQGKAQIHARLSELDEKIMKGAPPESLAAERAKLLSNAEALEELGDAVKSARLDQGSAKEKREVSFGLAKAGALADAIGSGKEPASRLRGEIFVLKQTFQEPLLSKENPAVQSGAAALQILGAAEQQVQQQRDAVAAAAAKGQDMRQYDGAVAQLTRRAEDLEAMRKGIADADLGGLTPAQEAKGAEIIDQMRAIAVQVANGQDFGKSAKAYEGLAQQLRDLRRGAPKPPAPASNDDVVPTPAPVTPPAPTPASTATKPYTVKKGDYLTKIAREQLGDLNRFQEIVRLNQDKYPSLKTNPDLIQPGWVLQIPAKGGAAPAPAGEVTPAPKPKPKPAPKPQPAPPKPQPKPPVTPVDPPAPAATGLSDAQALDWARRNADDQGRISRDTIAKMPAGPGKDALLKHFDALLFGTIDPGREGWTHLHAGDLDKIAQALRGGKSIDQLATDLTMNVLLDRKVGDKNADGRMDEQDVRAYARELRAQSNAPTPPAPTPAANEPAVNAPTQRLREDLDHYLNQPENRDDSEAILHLLRTAPQYAVAASPEQKARLIKVALDGSANADERKAAVTVLKMAAERGEVKAVLAAADTKGLKDLLSDLGDEKEGIEAAGILRQAGAYGVERTWKAMDDDAVRGFAKSLGYKEPMIGTSDELRALPDAAKHHMIKELLAGNLTWGELAIAEWINQHTTTKYAIPDYRNR